MPRPAAATKGTQEEKRQRASFVSPEDVEVSTCHPYLNSTHWRAAQRLDSMSEDSGIKHKEGRARVHKVLSIEGRLRLAPTCDSAVLAGEAE